MNNLSKCMPECMMPDGAEPCEGYKTALKRIAELEAAAKKTLSEQDEADEHHSAACMNWSFLEHSQHQCGLCDLRAALGEANITGSTFKEGRGERE